MNIASVLFCILGLHLYEVQSCYPCTTCVDGSQGIWMANVTECKSVYVDGNQKKITCPFEDSTLTCCAALKTGVIVKKPSSQIIADQKCQVFAKYLITEDDMSLLAGAETAKVNHCVRDRTTLIVGGEDAALGDIPFQVQMGYKEKTTENVKFMCGGSLLCTTFAITAAHCCNPHPSYTDIYQVRGGAVTGNPDDGFIVKVQEVIPHPKYTKEQLYHDIALVRFSDPIELSPSVVPVCLQCLPERNACDMFLSAGKGTISGFGKKSYGGVAAETLQKTQIQPYDFANCSAIFGKPTKLPYGLNSTIQLCAYADGKDTCQGDSGGPLFTESDVPCMSTLVGCTSFGRGCAVQGSPGVYVNVCAYIDWIVEIVWPLG